MSFPEYNQNEIVPDDILVQESDLFKDVEGSDPNQRFGVDVRDNGIAGLSEPEIQVIPTQDLPTDTTYLGMPEAEVTEESVILGQDFGQQDISGYNFIDPLDPSYLFTDPSGLGNPDGIETIYAPLERDRFRADWADGDFRAIEGYEGDLLSAEDMMLVQDAQNFLSNIELNARAGNWSTTEDYLRSLEQSDPIAYDQLVDEFNRNAGIWDTYGDKYQFQSSYNRLESRQSEGTPPPSDLTNAAAALLQAFVDQKIISPQDASSIVGNPNVLADWYSNILQYEGTGDLTPSPSSSGDLTTSPSSSIETDELFYYSDDANEERPYIRDASGNFVPYLAENEFVDNEGRVLRLEGNDITVVRDQYDYPDGLPPGQQQQQQQQQQDADIDGLDINGRTLIYPSWDTEEDYAFVFNPVTGEHEEAILPGQFVDSQGRLLTDDGATVVREDFDHGFGFFDPSPGVDDAGNIIPPTSGIATAPGRLPADIIPVNDDNLYDVQTDEVRAGADVLSLIYDPDLGVDLPSLLSQGFQTNSPIYDPDLFVSVSQDEYNRSSGPKGVGQRQVAYDQTPQPGDRGGFWPGSFFGQADIPSEREGYEDEYFILRNPVDASQVQYQQFNVFDHGLDNFQVPSPNDFVSDNPAPQPHKAFETNDLLNEQFDELVRLRNYDRPGRPGRAMAPGFGNPWEFNIFESQPVQEFFLNEINDFLIQTGLPLESVAMQDHEDILYVGEAEDVFDIDKFMQGYEDEDGNEVWGGVLDRFREFASQQELGSIGSDSDLLGMHSLERLALLTSGLTLPINEMVKSEGSLRTSGNDFDDTQSISSVVMGRLKPYAPPPFLGGGFTGYIDDEETLDFPTAQGNLNAFAGGSIQRMASGGYIGGIAGGMDDTVPATVDGSQPAALSAGEFVVPADVVSHLGDGNNQNGASKLYNFLDQVREVKTGSVEQPAPLDDGMMSGIMGDSYGR